MTARIEAVNERARKDLRLSILFGWLNPGLFQNDGTHWAVAKTVGEMGNLLFDVFDRLQDREAREKRTKEVKEKEGIVREQDRLDGTHYAVYVAGGERRIDTKKLLREAQIRVEAVANVINSQVPEFSFAAEKALEGKPMATEAILKGTSKELFINRFTGVAHLMAAVVDIEHRLRKESHSPYGLIQIPLPESQEGRDHLEAGLILVSRDIIQFPNPQNPHE